MCFQRFYQPAVLTEQNMKLCASGDLYVPEPASFENMLAYVAGLPQVGEIFKHIIIISFLFFRLISEDTHSHTHTHTHTHYRPTIPTSSACTPTQTWR